MKNAYLSCSFQAHSGLKEGVKHALSLRDLKVNSFTKDCDNEKLIEQSEVFVSITPPYNYSLTNLPTKFSLSDTLTFRKKNLRIGMGVLKEFNFAKNAYKNNKEMIGIIVLPFFEEVNYIKKRVTLVAYDINLIDLKEHELKQHQSIDYNDAANIQFRKEETPIFGSLAKFSADIPTHCCAETLNIILSTLASVTIQQAINTKHINAARMKAFREKRRQEDLMKNPFEFIDVKTKDIEQKDVAEFQKRVYEEFTKGSLLVNPLTPSECYLVVNQTVNIKEMYQSILNKYKS